MLIFAFIHPKLKRNCNSGSTSAVLCVISLSLVHWHISTRTFQFYIFLSHTIVTNATLNSIKNLFVLEEIPTFG